MPEFNPYAAPVAPINLRDVRLPNHEAIWRDGKILVMRKGAELPSRCLRCNAVADGPRLKRKLSWHHPAWYILAFFYLIIYIIVALCVRQTAKVAASFCASHRSKRRWAIAYGWLGSVIGITLMGVGFTDREYSYLVPTGLLVSLISLVVGFIRFQYLVPQRIDKDFVRLKKVCPEFLDALPEWQALA